MTETITFKQSLITVSLALMQLVIFENIAGGVCSVLVYVLCDFRIMTCGFKRLVISFVIVYL